MSYIESLNNVSFNGLMLNQISGIEKSNTEENIFTCTYANVEQSHKESSSHYLVKWDLSEFFSAEENQIFEWESPHNFLKVDKKEKDSVIEYFTRFSQFNKDMTINGIKIKVINRPIRLYTNNVIFWSAAIDDEGNVYKVYWNVANLLEPSKIELTLDNSRYCKKCLQSWMPYSLECVDDKGHEYVKNV